MRNSVQQDMGMGSGNRTSCNPTRSPLSCVCESCFRSSKVRASPQVNVATMAGGSGTESADGLSGGEVTSPVHPSSWQPVDDDKWVAKGFQTDICGSKIGISDESKGSDMKACGLEGNSKLGAKYGSKGKEPMVVLSEQELDSDSLDEDCLEEDFLMSNFDNDEGLLIEQLEEELTGQDNQVHHWRGVDGDLEGIAQLFMQNKYDEDVKGQRGLEQININSVININSLCNVRVPGAPSLTLSPENICLDFS